MKHATPWIAAAEAARLLNVSRATLYAYVSRGFVRSQAAPGRTRERRYSREDLERLRRRSEERRDPDKAGSRALQWGVPVLESAITLIDGERLYYRGHDAARLALSRPVAEVASLLWTGSFDYAFPAGGPALPALDSKPELSLPFAARAQRSLALAAAHDPGAFDLRPAGVAATGWRIVRLLAGVAAGGKDAATVDQRLARAWGVAAAKTELLRAALILCADHELNVSSFTARCVASAGSNPYAVVLAGLAALEGTRHGGMGARVEAMLESVHGARSLRSAVAERLRRGEAIHGFGHPLYRNGDPRAGLLFDLLRDHYGKSAELAFVLEVMNVANRITGEKPNIDFALAAMARVMRLPAGSAFTLFAIGRSMGWIGHAIEQYATGQLIRPRAKYVGVAP